MDREKVIKSLIWFRDRDLWREGLMIHEDHAEVRKQICDNAISLLKEQEAVKPQTENAVYDIGSWWYICGACKKPIDKTDTFCRHCGRSVKWE